MSWKCEECGSVNEGDALRCTCGYERTSIRPRKGRRLMKSLLWAAEFVSLFGLLFCLLGHTETASFLNEASEARELWMSLAGSFNLGEDIFAVAAVVFAIILYRTGRKRHGH